METIAVYGSGTIGSCEATLIIGHGLPCVVIGHSERGLERCRKAIEQNWDDLIAEGLATEKNKAAALKLLTITNDPVALAGCTFVFEAVAEGTEQKQEVYQAIEQYAAPNAVIASCTSSIDAEVLAKLTGRPENLLLDEPCSALDVKSTQVIEELLLRLKERYTIVIVTHNLFQARRISDDCMFLLNGRLWEQNTTGELFAAPRRQETREYLQGMYA